jgi:hypothetical protein
VRRLGQVHNGVPGRASGTASQCTTPVKDHPIRSNLVDSSAVGAGYRLLSSQVATLGLRRFLKLPVELRAALSISHGSYQHMQDAGH